MLKIRLKRFGRKKHPSYRIIAIDSRKQRDGRAIEELGFYDPINNQVKINTGRIEKRVRDGAQLTEKIQNIMKKVKSKA
uniref:Small ribosomal subunit protein bS16c n=1 Tax=Melanthalia intermedia TaxID=172989 RepID=A0A345UB09_9FLOR|nr:ribosomal protein S16 [Melanthalia intermedia]AXI97645.1 ribosomal protein S16 [Melanthalia intermedia]